MYLKMEYIQKELAGQIDEAHIIHNSNLFSFKLYEESIQEFDEKTLYLCLFSDLSDLTKGQLRAHPLNLMIFGSREDDLSFLEQSNYLLVCAALTDLLSYINVLSDIFHRYNSWEQKLNHLMVRGGNYQDAIDIGNELISVPMAMMDINHQILAVTKNCETQDTLLFSISHGYGYHFLNIINRSNPTLDEVSEQGVCEVINNISGKRLRVYKIRKDSYSSFFIGFHKADVQLFHPADLCLFQFFVLYLEQLVAVYEKKQSSMDSDFALFMEELILNETLPESLLYDAAEKFHLSDVRLWQLLCIKFNHYLSFRTTYHYEIMNQIRQIITGCHCTLINSSVVVLLDGGIEIDHYLSALQYLLVTNDAICACSAPYSDLAKTRRVREQLQFVLSRPQTDQNTTVRFYRDYAREHFLSVLKEQLPEQTLYHSALYQVQAFDIQNHTDYLPTLICYLQNNCSMNTTAGHLQIHRNSLLYRIRKIEELLGFEIADSPERIPMLFSSFLIPNSQTH